MATHLCGRKAAQRLITYSLNAKNLQASVLQVKRLFSGYEGKDELSGASYFDDYTKSRSVTWPDETMGPLNTPDKKFALPGNIGISLLTKNEDKKEKLSEEPDVLSVGSSADRHLSLISQLISESDYLDPDHEPDPEMSEQIFKKYFEEAKVEVAIQDCPKIIRKDFNSLFLDMPESEKLTVITITQRTENDMSSWSPEIEIERESLLENFMKTATEICHILRVHQYWCDFIDPSTGKPHIGSYTNTTFYEFDDRYRHLGFEIEDLGCCKVIYHREWKTKIFVGSVFTTAPKEQKVIQNLLSMLK